MTLDDIMRDIQAMREDLLVFERKYGVPTEIFYEAYRRGEEPDDSAWVLDWSEWAATQQLLQERLAAYNSGVRRLLVNTVVTNLTELIGRTARSVPGAPGSAPHPLGLPWTGCRVRAPVNR